MHKMHDQHTHINNMYTIITVAWWDIQYAMCEEQCAMQQH